MKAVPKSVGRSSSSVLVSFCVVFLFSTAEIRVHAQDGKIVDSYTVLLTDDDAQKHKNADPELANALSQVKLEAITYLSNGLKVKGYLAMPKTGDNLPCVIYNRGGGPQPEALLTDVRAPTYSGASLLMATSPSQRSIGATRVVKEKRSSVEWM